MKKRNYVAKHMKGVCKGGAHKDKTRYTRKTKHKKGEW